MITLLSLILWLTAQASPGSIAGIALSAGTTQPLENVDVELRPSLLVSRTDAGGKFTFPVVPPGRYILVVERDGIQLQVPVVVTSGLKLERVVLRVNSAPTISGTVYDPYGERLAAARVQAYKLSYSPYGLRLKSVRSTITDDLGQYRLFWLPPGEYSVAASYTERDQRSATIGLHLSPNLSKPDDGYVTTYFGGSLVAAQSQRVRLDPRRDAGGVSMYLVDGPLFTVSGTIVMPPGSCPVRLAFVPEGGVLNEDTDFVTDVCGTFQIRGVSPGYYVLLATSKGGASDVTRVNVEKDVDLKVILMDTVNLSGQISMDGRRPGLSLSGTRVTLIRSSREIEQGIHGRINPDGSFLVQDVGPGDYDVTLEQPPDGAYVRSIRLGAIDVTAGRMRIASYMSSRPPSLDIALSSIGGIAEGTVVDRSGQPMAGAQVVLAPNTLRTREDRYKLVLSDAAGNYRASGIAPGSYTAFAFEQLDPGAHFAFLYDVQLFNRYKGKGTSVDLTENGRQTVSLIALPAEETAGGLR